MVYELITNIEHWSNDNDIGKTEVFKEKPFHNAHFFQHKSHADSNLHHIMKISPFPGKGKAVPLQAWTGPEGSRRLRLPDFNTIGT